jgi:hypothetical protein
MGTEQAPAIAQLVDVAARLRTVRRAQRRFLRRWAQERTDRWIEALTASDRASRITDVAASNRFNCDFPKSDLRRDDLLDDVGD